MNAIAPYWKAILGFIAPGAITIGSAVTDASDGGSRITQAEWVTALVAMVVTGAAVYSVPNRDPEGTHQQDSVQPPHGNLRGDHGQASHALLIALAAIAIIGLALLLTGVLDVRGR